MSVGYYPKNEQASNQAQSVQELTVSGSDPQLFQISGGNCYIMVREPVGKVYLASCKVDSTNLVTQFAAASIIISDSGTLAAGGNQGAIKLTGLAALNPLDVVIVRYSVLEHL